MTTFVDHGFGTIILPICLLNSIRLPIAGTELRVIYSTCSVLITGRNLRLLAAYLKDHHLAWVRASDERTHPFGKDDVYVSKIEILESK